MYQYVLSIQNIIKNLFLHFISELQNMLGINDIFGEFS